MAMAGSEETTVVQVQDHSYVTYYASILHISCFCLFVVRYRKDTKTPCREEVEGMIVTSPFSVRRGVYTKSVRFQRICVNYMIAMT